MEHLVRHLMQSFSEIHLVYCSKSYLTVIFSKYTTLFNRRKYKILTNLVSTTTSAYIFFFKKFFAKKADGFPVWEGKLDLLPNKKAVKDFLRWKQSDLHMDSLRDLCVFHMKKNGVNDAEK